MLKVATKFPPHAKAFEAAVAAGFRYAEFWLDANLLSQWQAVAAEAKKHPLAYALHFPNRGNLSDATLREATELYRQLECSAMVIHAPMYRRYGTRLLELEPSLRLGVENHRLNRDEFKSWGVGNTWLTLDVEHLWKFTLTDTTLDELLAEVGRFLAEFGHKLVHIHLPGYVPGHGEHRPMYCGRDMVLQVWSLLSDYQFDGLIVGEADGPFQNVHELRMDILLFERWKELRRAEETHTSSTGPHVAQDCST